MAMHLSSKAPKKAEASAAKNINKTSLQFFNTSSPTTDDIQDAVGIPIAGEVACEYNNTISGTLYAGPCGLLFCGTFLFLERKIAWPWEHVRRVDKTNTDGSVVLPVLRVYCRDKTMHDFVRIQSIERVWTMLLTLHNQALIDKPPKAKVVIASDVNENGEDDTNSKGENKTPKSSSSDSNDKDVISPVSSSKRNHRRQQSDPMRNSLYGIELDEYQLDHTGELTREKTADRVLKHAPSDPTVESSGGDIPPPPPTSLFNRKGQGLPNVSVDNDLVQVEHSVGKIRLQPLTCTYKGHGSAVKGKLYAGSNGLAFFGTRYFWENHVLVLKFKSINKIDLIRKDDDNTKPYHGLSITCRNESTKHEFADIESAESIRTSMLALQNEALARTPLIKKHKTLQRMNSDPTMASQRSIQLEKEGQPNNTKDFVKKQSNVSDKAVDGRPEAPLMSAMSTEHTVQEVLSEDDSKIKWDDIVKQSPLKNIVVQDFNVPTTLDKFFRKFIDNNAEFSLDKFMSGHGDFDINVTDWEQKDEIISNRIVRYYHPVNVPMAPPKAAARKEQTCYRYNGYGLCVETKTIVDDVPMADCFYVLDRMTVRASETEMLLVTLEFEIKFVKSTMFKGIISNTTTSEVKAAQLEYSAFLLSDSKGMEKEEVIVVADIQSTESVEKEKPTVTTPTSPLAALPTPTAINIKSMTYMYMLLVFILLYQMKAANEMHELRREIRALSLELQQTKST